MEPTTDKKQGTTLAILQAYPLGALKVHLVPNDRYGTLTGLGTAHKYDLEAIVSVDTDRGTYNVGCACSTLLPYLRTFDMLDKELPDGTVPVVEVAKLAYRFPEDPHLARLFDLASIKIRKFASEVQVSIALNFSCIVTSNYKVFWQDATSSPANNQVAIVDYLRKNLFALPVNGRPLVEGVDFLRLA